MLVLIACPHCDTVMGRCDEVEELIRDPLNPHFDQETSICHGENPCPVCNLGRYCDFRAATEAELIALGLPVASFQRWSDLRR